MKTEDFEKAIDALGCKIYIDEMVIRKGSVDTVYAHMENEYLKWDAHGRGFSCVNDSPLPLDKPVETKLLAEDWERSECFDLNF